MGKKDWEQRLSIDKELRILWKLCLGLEENVKSVKKYVKRVETARYQQKNTQPQAEEKSTFEDGVDFKEEVIKMKHKFEYNPEKKEWKKKIPMWIKEDLFEEVTDDRGTRILGYVNCSDRVLDFIEQEIDRAREEGRKAERDRIFRGLDSIDCIKEALPKNYSASGMQFGIYRAKEIVLEKELSKLTTK